MSFQWCLSFFFHGDFKMRREILFVAAAVLSLCVVSPASADFALANGNFETVAGGLFSGWDMSPSVESSASVISGTYSAECRKEGSGSGMDARQSVDYVPDSTLSADFACFPTALDTNRTFQLSIGYKNSGDATVSALNFRVVGSGLFQGYNGSAYQTISGLPAALTTVDQGSDLAWVTETPVVNHLEIATHYSAATPSYDVTLNGVTTSGITWFQYAAPTAAVVTTVVTLAGDACVSNFLADNMTIGIPEPSTLVLSIAGIVGLMAYACRKRK
jgi:hypothetical protein